MVGPFRFFVFVFVCVWTRHIYWATNWRAVLATALWIVEGYRTADEALVCCRMALR